MCRGERTVQLIKDCPEIRNDFPKLCNGVLRRYIMDMMESPSPGWNTQMVSLDSLSMAITPGLNLPDTLPLSYETCLLIKSNPASKV